MEAGEGRRELAELAAVGARREGRAGAAFEALVEQVDLHLEAAIGGARPALLERRRQAAEQGPGGPAAARALGLELLVDSLAAVGPRAAKAHAVAYSFHLICLIVLALSELVIALVLVLERERWLAPRFEVGPLFCYVLLLQFFLIPAFLRWLDRKLLWETYDGVCAELGAALEGLERELAR